MVNPLENFSPRLAKGDYRETSPKDPIYNCIAWAVGETGKWWWPGPNLDEEYWPTGVPRELSVSAFQIALASIGFVVCQSNELEPGFEKIALFSDSQEKPTHAARQLPHWPLDQQVGKIGRH